jgi:YidC/Oxa1 family membrane protein insertase
MAVVLSMLVLVGWNLLFPPPQPQQPPQQEQQARQVPAPSADIEQSKAIEVPAFQATSGRQVTVKTPLYTAVFNSNGGLLEHMRLARYKETIEPGSEQVDLVGEAALAKAPMGLLLDGRATWRDYPWSFQGQDLNLSGEESDSLIFTADVDGMRLRRTLSFRADSYLIQETVSLQNAGQARGLTRVGFTLASGGLSAKDNRYDRTRVAWYTQGGGLEDEADEDDLQEGVLVEQNLLWGGVQSNYFLIGVAPEQVGVFKGKLEGEVYRVAMEHQWDTVAAGATVDTSCTYFLGPKKNKALAGAPNQMEKAINLGWFDFIAQPLLQGLKFFHGYVNNYGVAIVILTIIIKLVFWPLSQKSYKSMNQMKKLQPMMAKIREKYKDDRQKMNEEMMSLYKTYKVNPAGGCLPMLLQIPVFIGLYQALLNSIELRHAAFITHVPFTDIIWLADLSAKDPFYVTPLVMGATMFLQQKMTPSPGDPTQAKIMLLMPVFFTFIFLNFPAGLVVYWLVNNVLSIAQQGWMLRKA